MRKQVIILLVVIATCSAQNGLTESGRKKHHLHHLYHSGILHYWAFLALKAKIIFLIGTFISFWVVAGKAFAFLYYIKNNKESCKCPDYHSEKIIVSHPPHFEDISHTPHFEDKYSTIFNSLPPDDYYPSNGQRPHFSPYNSYSRSIENSVFANMDVLKSVIKKMDLTELAFDAMNLKRKSCKMRFVCEAEQKAKDNSLLAFSLYMFSDVGIMKYRTNSTQLSMEDCKSLGPHCDFI